MSWDRIHRFWCHRRFDNASRSTMRTREHLVPKALGGKEGDNLRWACYECNHRRGQLYECVRVAGSFLRAGTVLKWDALSEYRHWEEIEKLRIGHSILVTLRSEKFFVLCGCLPTTEQAVALEQGIESGAGPGHVAVHEGLGQ